MGEAITDSQIVAVLRPFVRGCGNGITSVKVPGTAAWAERGRLFHRALGMLPVVGMAGDYLGERSGLKRVWKRAHEWFTQHPGGV